MKSGLIFEVIYTDEHLTELEVSVRSNGFSGSTQVYTTGSRLARLAKSLQGFPREIDDRVTIEFGAKNGQPWVDLDFYCFTGRGNTLVYVEMEFALYDDRPKKHDRRSVAVELEFEVQSLVYFVTDLKEIAQSGKGRAELIGARPYMQ